MPFLLIGPRGIRQNLSSGVPLRLESSHYPINPNRTPIFNGKDIPS